MTPRAPRPPCAKIVATLGPATKDASTLEALVEAGVDVFRINASHGTESFRVGLIERVHALRERTGRAIGLLMDLQGPRIRIGELAWPIDLAEGARVVFAPEDEANQGEIPCTYAALARDVGQGDRILIDDGLVEVRVEASDGLRVSGTVVEGGVVRSQKGINLPGVDVTIPQITEKDRRDIDLVHRHRVDFVGLSFVRRAADVETARSLLPPDVAIIAKIELARSLSDLEAIVEAADGIMVARGDLGVELPFEEVPIAQKRIIACANRRGRPVITATQMLESMVESPRPTRAEASDVANAVLDGTDAVMLSAETAVGAHAIAAVEAMRRIVVRAEQRVDESRAPLDLGSIARGPVSVSEAIAAATVVAGELLEIPLICCLTTSGFTARQIAAARPTRPLVGLTPKASTFHQMALTWGIRPVRMETLATYDSMLAEARDVIVREGHATPGDAILVTAGAPFELPGTTNLLKVETV